MTDAELEKKIAALKQTIKSWAEKHGLWQDADFTTFDEHFDVKPLDNPYVLVLCFEGPLFDLMNGYAGNSDLINEFNEVIDRTEFFYELKDHVTMVFMAKEDELVKQYQKYFNFRWVCKLVIPDFAEIYQELFEHFSSYPDDLHQLDPRKFECLLESIFRNHGYRTELGPGWSDGGIDLRLYQKDAIGEIVTLVQAKRYKQNAPIRLEAVAALKAIVDNENANRGLFVTTSRFLPGVRKFAQQQSRRLELATSEDISKWCKKINEQLQKSSYTDVADEVMQMLKEGNVPKSLVGKIVHTRWGYNMIINKFRLVIKETSKAVLLKELPTEIVNHDGYEQSGYEIPIIPNDFQLKADDEFHYIRARKEEQDGKLFFWGDDQNLYTIWNGQPQYFDYCD